MTDEITMPSAAVVKTWDLFRDIEGESGAAIDNPIDAGRVLGRIRVLANEGRDLTQPFVPRRDDR